MNSIGSRLREERHRLRLNQAQMARCGGVRMQAQVRYEKGDRSPDAMYLAGIALHGVDAKYVLTGERSVEWLTHDEWALVGKFRSVDLRARSGLLACVVGIAPERGWDDSDVQCDGRPAGWTHGATFNKSVSLLADAEGR